MWYSISEKKKKQIQEYEQKPFEVGDNVYVKKSDLYNYVTNDNTEFCTILSIDKNKVKVKSTYSSNSIYDLTTDKLIRDIRNVGFNPFDKSKDMVRVVAFQLSSIIHTCDLMNDKGRNYNINGVKIGECNMNPFVYLPDGTKKYYQRPLVWNTQQKQLLIESIYENIDCGKIIVRLRSWKTIEKMQAQGETELYFKDLVDGKQRLNAIKEFMNNEFPDMHGNYYSDLSSQAQHLFTNHQLFSYGEMGEDTSDEQVLNQFLKLNFTGVPQSTEHIEFVKSLKEKY